MDISALKDFVDLGGVFILALVILYFQGRQLESIKDMLVKVLTLLAIVTKAQTNFNGVDKVLGQDGDKVADTIVRAEAGETPSL